MKSPWRIVRILVFISILGFYQGPLERLLSRELLDRQLIPARLNLTTTEKIGQTSYAITLGGLRTLVATLQHLKSYQYFEQKRWSDLHQSFETIVNLAPQTPIYWDLGSWHLIYNASAYYAHQSKLPTLRRRDAWQHHIREGKAFLERGILANPNDSQLLSQLGYLLSRNPDKMKLFGTPDECFSQAADAYAQAASKGDVLGSIKRSQFYCLAKTTHRHPEALQLGRHLFRESKRNQTPNLLNTLFALEMEAAPNRPPFELVDSLFGSSKSSYQSLSNYWQKRDPWTPTHSVASTLRMLENELVIPTERSAILQKAAPEPSQNNWFER